MSTESPARAVTRLPAAARTIIAGFGISYFGTGLILPINAIYLAQVLRLPSAVTAAFFLLLPAAGLVGGVVGGRLVDRIGTRIVGSVGFALQGLGWLTVPFAGHPVTICAAAVVAGLGTGTVATALRSQLSLVVDSALRGRAFAVRNLAINLGAAAGACAVAGLAAVGSVPYRGLYIVDALTFAIFGAIMWRLTRQPGTARRPGSEPDIGVLRRPGVLAGLVGHMLVFAFGLALVESAFPLLLEGLLAQSVSTVGVALAVSTITAVLIQLPVERGLRRFSMRARFAWHTGCWLLAWTLGAMSGAVPGPARTALILAMMVVFSAGACVYHAVFQARLADLVPAAQTGRVNGLVSVAFNVGTVLGSAGFVLVLAQLSRSWQAFVLLGLGAAAAGVALQRFATATPNDEPAVA